MTALTLRDQDTGLTQRELLVLHMDLAGIYDRAAIASATGYALNSITIIRSKPLYKAAFAKMQEMVKRARQEAMLRAVDRLDSLVPEAIDTFAALNREADSDSVRLKAAQSICDYAPNGPKKDLASDKAPQRALFLQLGSGKIKEIHAALADAGVSDVLDLMKHIDWDDVSKDDEAGAGVDVVDQPAGDVEMVASLDKAAEVLRELGGFAGQDVRATEL